MVYFVLQHKCWIKIQETLLAYNGQLLHLLRALPSGSTVRFLLVMDDYHVYDVR